MRSIKWALASALVVVAAMPPVLALAQSNGAARDIAWPPAGVLATAGMLAPPEIEAAVRRAGVEPLNPPPPPGTGFVLFALGPHDNGVELTLPAGSGRRLWVAGGGGAPGR